MPHRGDLQIHINTMTTPSTIDPVSSLIDGVTQTTLTSQAKAKENMWCVEMS